MKKITLLLAVILFAVSARASHYFGGELRYEFNGTDYTLYFDLYRICGSSSAPLPPNAVVKVSSVAAGVSLNITLNAIGYDSLGLGCPAGINACTVPSSKVPGYIVAHYSANVAFPSQQTDWVMSYLTGTRANAINITNSTGIDYYTEALLNNSTAVNSSPVLPNKPNFYMTVGQPLYVPLQGLDAEGDSIAYEIVPALEDVATPVGYATGYSGTSPFGTAGLCNINANNTLVLKSTSQGMYVVAIKVKDYRKGVLVGSYIREMTCMVLPGSSSLTFPMPNPLSVFEVYTCPGQSNSISVTFDDSTATDSVYLSVTPPSMMGWAFTPTISNGLASASVSIAWNTPAGLNPATMPSFYIPGRARDNGCPRAYTDFAILVRTRQCSADSVWPGDANGDYTVNIYDPLAIAIANGDTGPGRTGATTSWTPQACTNWGSTFVTNNTDIKHADCNGDGTVNSTDLAAVAANWGQWHLKGGSNQKTTGAPELYFDLKGVVLMAGTQARIPVMIGRQTTTINDFYGLATVIDIDGITLATQPAINVTGSWLGSTLLNFSHAPTNNALHWANAKMNHMNSSGYGKLGTLEFMVPANAKVGDKVTLGFAMTRAIDKDGQYISINTTDAVVTIAPTSVNNTTFTVSQAAVVPNPSGAEASLQFNIAVGSSVGIIVTDVVGKTIWQHSGEYVQGKHTLALPDNLPGGMYIVQLMANGAEAQQLKWIKK